MDVSKGREHDCMDAGGRATQGAVAEERKLRQQISTGKQSLHSCYTANGNDAVC
ncbi:hypothetical protein [Methylobacter tundripaludum]|uniref:hypothetical protein n=1 Tax=Methylobacter tundripaludum TaxID=173365 RepID=UPI000A7459EA|nr:hypothetical protein [Methylobacter tundripaludum]